MGRAERGLNLPAMLIYVASVLPVTIILTWIYNNTRGSLLLVILAHASINTFSIYIGPMFPAQAGGSPRAKCGSRPRVGTRGGTRARCAYAQPSSRSRLSSSPK